MMIRKGMFIGDRYEIIDKVGSGGMSDVYKALDHKLNRYVAVKVLKDEFSEDKSFVSKFKVEAQSAAGLAHPNIVNVFDVGEENGLYFIVMELVEGITLKKYIEKKGKLPVKEAVSIAIQIAQGIEAAHNNHIIHRDIKPQNVIISREGKVKVTDFGIARAASANTINSNAMGSVHYISPEQARGGYIDEKSDIYSLGISLYEMITGKVPFEGDSTVTIALQHINEELPSPKLEVMDLPISVEKIIEKCTQKKSERRYLKVAALIADLKKSLITPDEDFVVMAPTANNNATIMITDEEVSLIRKSANAAAMAKTDVENADGEETVEDDSEENFDFDDDIDAANPKYDKIVTIGAIVTSVVVLIVFILILVNVLKGCDSDEKDPYQTTTQAQTGLLSTQTIVPNVLGMTEEEAQKALKNANLGIRYEYEYHNTVPKGEVIKQDVADGTIVDKTGSVTVTVSKGAQKFDIPPVADLSREEAIKLLQDEEKYGLNVKVEYVPSEEIEAETCIKTVPAAPIQLTYGAAITLYVSSGVDDAPVELPKMVGKTKDSVKNELEKLGLIVDVKEEFNSSVASGYVIAADFKEGQSVPKGTTVTLSVSKGEEPTTHQQTTTPKPVKKVKKTEITIKKFDDSMFDLPQIAVPGNSEDETTLVNVEKGTLSASLIVKHDGMTTTVPATNYIATKYEKGYKHQEIKIQLDILNVTEVTFVVNMVYKDADGNEQSAVKVFDEPDCHTDEIEIEVTE